METVRRESERRAVVSVVLVDTVAWAAVIGDADAPVAGVTCRAQGQEGGYEDEEEEEENDERKEGSAEEAVIVVVVVERMVAQRVFVAAFGGFGDSMTLAATRRRASKRDDFDPSSD
jgi:hypothetical protein